MYIHSFTHSLIRSLVRAIEPSIFSGRVALEGPTGHVVQ